MKPSELIADPAKWTKGSNARAKNGAEIAARSPSAVKWCVDGALFRCFHSAHSYASAHHKLLRTLFNNNYFAIVKWNDAPERTHAEVLAALKACGL